MLAVWELEHELLHELGQAAHNYFGAQIVAVAAPY